MEPTRHKYLFRSVKRVVMFMVMFIIGTAGVQKGSHSD